MGDITLAISICSFKLIWNDSFSFSMYFACESVSLHSAKSISDSIWCSHESNFPKILYRTSSTRPKPPTPSVSMMLKSLSFRLEKKAFSASYLEIKTQGHGHQTQYNVLGSCSSCPAFPNKDLVLPAAFDHMEEWELPGGLDGVRNDGEGEGGRRRSREAGEPLSLLPHWDRNLLSHLQTLF